MPGWLCTASTRCVKSITLEPGGVTIFNSIALIRPARTEHRQDRSVQEVGGGKPRRVQRKEEVEEEEVVAEHQRVMVKTRRRKMEGQIARPQGNAVSRLGKRVRPVCFISKAFSSEKR